MMLVPKRFSIAYDKLLLAMMASFTSRTILFTAIYLGGVANLGAQALYVPGGASGVGNSGTSNVGIGMSSNPLALLHVRKGYPGVTSYPTTVSTGDVLAVFEHSNQSIEFGVAGSLNARTSWILARHSSVPAYGGYFSTLHLQPDTAGVENDYEGVAIGYDPSVKSSPGAGLVVGKNVGIGTTAPAAMLHLGGSNQEIRIDYNGTSSFYGSLRWSGIQFGNNGVNRLVAGRTQPGGAFEFFVNNTNEGADYQSAPNGLMAMRIAANGNVGIGTTTPSNALDVNGTVRAKEVIVATNWPDYVFQPDYNLRPLGEVAAHIEQHGHLPGVPSADEVEANGVSIGDSQRVLLEKIEELTLYAIEQREEMQAMKLEIETLKAQLAPKARSE